LPGNDGQRVIAFKVIYMKAIKGFLAFYFDKDSGGLKPPSTREVAAVRLTEGVITSNQNMRAAHTSRPEGTLNSSCGASRT